MKKVLALALVLVMAASLFVAAPANAVAPVTNYMAATDETITSFIPAIWNWGQDPSALYFWCNYDPSSANPALTFNSVNYPLSAPISFGGNTIAGSRVLNIKTNYGNQYAVQFTSQPLPAGNYTFFYWVKASNIVDVDGNPVATPNQGFFSLDVKSNGTDVVNTNQTNSWWITYKTIADANADTDAAGETLNGINNVAAGSFGWSLVRTRFTISEAQANKRCKIELTLLGGIYGASYDIDGMGIVAGNNVPDFDVLYVEDMDRDGIKNINDTDMDGDGILNVSDADANGDTIDDATDVDVDKDGIINKYDPDIDNDGIKNIFDKDIDGDYILNIYDRSPMGCLLTQMPA